MRDRSSGDKRPESVAFFDLDETLIGVNSANLWVRYQWESGQMSAVDLARSLTWLLRYKFSLIDMQQVVSRVARRLEGTPEAQMRDDVRAWFEREVRPHFIPEMIERVASHRREGHRVVLLTASSPYIAEQAAAHAGLDDFICTRFEVRDGLFTGRLIEPMCYGVGKVDLARRWARERGFDLSHSYFYTDSYTDLPMLEAVGYPVVVNADPRLDRHAKRVGYEQWSFDSPVNRR